MVFPCRSEGGFKPWRLLVVLLGGLVREVFFQTTSPARVKLFTYLGVSMIAHVYVGASVSVPFVSVPSNSSRAAEMWRL